MKNPNRALYTRNNFLMVYRNYECKVQIRNIAIKLREDGWSLHFFIAQNHQFHADGEVLFRAMDLDRAVERDYSVDGILAWGQGPVLEFINKNSEYYDINAGVYNLPEKEFDGVAMADALRRMATHQKVLELGEGHGPQKNALDECRSAAKPCGHQKKDPYSLCSICAEHNTTPPPKEGPCPYNDEVPGVVVDLKSADGPNNPCPTCGDLGTIDNGGRDYRCPHHVSNRK